MSAAASVRTYQIAAIPADGAGAEVVVAAIIENLAR